MQMISHINICSNFIEGEGGIFFAYLLIQSLYSSELNLIFYIDGAEGSCSDSEFNHLSIEPLTYGYLHDITSPFF